MDDKREELWQRIKQKFKEKGAWEGKVSLSNTFHSPEEIINWTIEAIDEFIEEQGEEGTPRVKAGDTVKLKRQLREGDGSMTDQVCSIAGPMEEVVPCQPCGTVIQAENDEILVHLFTDDEWYFHVDDLEKVHT